MRLRVAPGVIDVWRIDLDGWEAIQPNWRAHVLTPEESMRAEAFATERLTSRFVAARAALRQVLALYLGVRGADVRFGVGPAGKPHLLHGARWPDFNLSHGDGQALIAVGGGPVGIDLEPVRSFADMDAVAQRVATEAERAVLWRGDAGLRTETFFRLWTLKEAVVKATGEGLGADLRRIDVSAALGNGGAGRVCAGDGLLEVRPLPAPTGFAAALATAEPQAVRMLEARFLPAAGEAPRIRPICG